MVHLNAVYSLKAINELLAQIGSVDPELVENARKAMYFFESEKESALASAGSVKNTSAENRDAGLLKGVDQLFQLYFGPSENRNLGLTHWHIPKTEGLDYLWMRIELNENLLRLSGYERAVFLITGARCAVQGDRAYWTLRQERALEEFKQWIEVYVVSKIGAQQKLSLLII